MTTTTVVIILGFIVALVAVLAVTVWGLFTKKRSAPVIVCRLTTALFLAVLGEFCVFGFLASLEPGDHLPWKIGYSLLGLSFFTSAIWLGFGAFKLRREAWVRVIVGLCLGAFIAFVLSFGTFMVGGRGGFKLAGVSYGLLAAPIGAAIGGVIGAWIGSRIRDERSNGSQTSDQQIA